MLNRFKTDKCLSNRFSKEKQNRNPPLALDATVSYEPLMLQPPENS